MLNEQNLYDFDELNEIFNISEGNEVKEAYDDYLTTTEY